MQVILLTFQKKSLFLLKQAYSEIPSKLLIQCREVYVCHSYWER